MVNAPVLLVGIVLLAVGGLFLAPMLGLALPFELPAIGPEVMGIPAVGIGLLVVVIVMLIAGIKMY